MHAGPGCAAIGGAPDAHSGRRSRVFPDGHQHDVRIVTRDDDVVDRRAEERARHRDGATRQEQDEAQVGEQGRQLEILVTVALEPVGPAIVRDHPAYLEPASS